MFSTYPNGYYFPPTRLLSKTLHLFAAVPVRLSIFNKSNENFIYNALFRRKIPLKVFHRIKTGMTRNALKIPHHTLPLTPYKVPPIPADAHKHAVTLVHKLTLIKKKKRKKSTAL